MVESPLFVILYAIAESELVHLSLNILGKGHRENVLFLQLKYS